MAYLETPRTDAGNATFMTNGQGLENFSVENSLLSPIKKKDDIISLMRNERGASLKTPRARAPLADRRNLPNGHKSSEFTPLLQSVTKRNLERNGKRQSGPETPAFLKAGYQSNNSPALPGPEASALYSSDFGSSVNGAGGSTPLPQVTSSSAQSTPLAVLPKRDPTGVLNEQGNLMTLREQENIIDKIEKENFGLKLKIHFLEDALRRAGPGFNEAALKENTDLKVDRITLQKELARCTKTLTQAERDIEAYRRHLEDLQAKAKKQHADASLQEELENLKHALRDKEEELDEFQHKFDAVSDNKEDIDALRGHVEDLEAELREKERQLESHEEELESAKAEAKKQSEELEDAYDGLQVERKRVEELESKETNVDIDATKLQDAQDDLQDALAAQRKAENDLEELQDEMANKSFTTKGLSRQLEEKLTRVQDELEEMRSKEAALQSALDEKDAEVNELMNNAQQKNSKGSQDLQEKCARLEIEYETTVRRCDSLNSQLQQSIADLQNKTEEKDLLISRHDALTLESRVLNRDLTKAVEKAQELEADLQSERDHAQHSERQLQSETRVKIDSLTEQADNLQRKMAERESQFEAERDEWESERRNVLAQKDKSEERAAGLQRTVNTLQEVEGTASGKEFKLQEALDSEKQRHEDEEAVLQRQIQDLNLDIQDKRTQIEELKGELTQAEEDVRFTEREKKSLEEKVQTLEDDVEVLQSELEKAGAQEVADQLESARDEIALLQVQLAEAKDHAYDLEMDADSSKANHDSVGLSRTQRMLEDALTDKNVFQDRLVSATAQLEQLQASVLELKAEKDELAHQAAQPRGRTSDVFAFDQEKIDLKASNLRIEKEVDRLRDERKSLIESKASAERRLDSELRKAAYEEARLVEEIDQLRTRVSKSESSGGRSVELNLAKNKIERLERRVRELEEQQLEVTKVTQHDDDAAMEINLLQKELSEARAKEAEVLRREASQKEAVREMKVKISTLERKARGHGAAQTMGSAAQTSTTSSAHHAQIAEMQEKLDYAQKQLRESRSISRDEIRSLQRQLTEAEGRVKGGAIEWSGDFQEQLESGLAAAQKDLEQLQTKNVSASDTIARLRSRIGSLEEDLRGQRKLELAEKSMARERKDLYELLKDAKLRAEDLEIQIREREESLTSAASKEKDLRYQLRRIREERDLESQKAAVLSSELDNVHGKFEDALDKHNRRQRDWDRNIRDMESRHRMQDEQQRGRFQYLESHISSGNTDPSRAQLIQEVEWLRAKWRREEGFRESLAYEKDYLLKDIAMREECSKTSLALLRKIIKTPFFDAVKDDPRIKLGDAIVADLKNGKTQRKPSLRVAGLTVLAVNRMKKLAREWDMERRDKEIGAGQMRGTTVQHGRHGKRKHVLCHRHADA